MKVVYIASEQESLVFKPLFLISVISLILLYMTSVHFHINHYFNKYTCKLPVVNHFP